MLDINDITPKAEIEIQWAIQDITINIPKNIGIQMRYKNKIGYKDTPNLTHQTGYLYTSDGLSVAKKILTLDINIFIGKLEINWK